MAMRGLRNRNQTSVIFLVMRLCQELYALEDKPPVTLVLLFGQIALHILMVPGKDYTYRDVCNWPAKILYDPNLYDWGKRVLLSSFIHADDYHLTSNMIAFLHKGAFLENMMGSRSYGLMVAIILVLSKFMNILMSYLMMKLFGVYTYMDMCSVGFSGVIFGLSAVMLAKYSGRSINFFGMRLSAIYSAWIDLIWIQFVNPQVSLMGHVGGLLAGLIYVYYPKVFLHRRQHNYRSNTRNSN